MVGVCASTAGRQECVRKALARACGGGAVRGKGAAERILASDPNRPGLRRADGAGSVREGTMAGDPGVAGGAQDALRQPEPIRVLIVDDHALFRRGLEMVLAEEADIEVVGE